ncbi:hypothetical protein ACRBEV_25690 [Methylobacterium phyllosphaerae]
MKVMIEITDLDNDALVKLLNEGLQEACDRGLIHTLIMADENEDESRHRYGTALGCGVYENPDQGDAPNLAITVLVEQGQPNIRVLKARETV